ncbi:MAG: type II toxin-antitoxin system VapC family toxin [Patescibacteria group bacterium]
MTIDTNILIAFLNQESVVTDQMSAWREAGVTLFVPTMVEAELLSFSGQTKAELEQIIRFLGENFISIPFDRTLARISGEIRRDSRLKFPDAAIAATALFTRTPLVTRNTKDFKRLKDLPLIQL